MKQRLHELEKCCGKYPSPRERKSDGARRIVCSVCERSTPYYLPSGLSANKGWNEMMQRQLKVESLYNGNPQWYKSEDKHEN